MADESKLEEEKHAVHARVEPVQHLHERCAIVRPCAYVGVRALGSQALFACICGI
jgi:hypothetical protein